MADIGCVTGRLQPMHLDHLDLFRIVLADHDRVVVAITNPDPGARQEHAEHAFRHLPEDNPFTFYERQAFVRAALIADGVPPARFEIVPFPLHSPDLVGHYVPFGATQYVRTYGSWEDGKAEMLRAYGYPVTVLQGNGSARRSGRDVRAALRSGGEWRHLVPKAVAAAVSQALDARGMAARA